MVSKYERIYWDQNIGKHVSCTYMNRCETMIWEHEMKEQGENVRNSVKWEYHTRTWEMLYEISCNSRSQ